MNLRQGGVAAIILGAAILSFEAGAAEPSSVYTELSSCKPLTALELSGRKLGAATGTPLRLCDGPPGFAMILVEDGERSWAAVQAKDRTEPLSGDMVERFKLGNFPNIAEPGRIEWRLGRDGQVKGLIVRVRYQRSDVPATAAQQSASVLMAFRLGGAGAPALLGSVTDNAAARALIDDAP